MNTHWKATCYLQDAEVLQSSKVRLGDPGYIISVQVTAMENRFRSEFCRLNVWFIQPRLSWTRGMLLVKEKAIPMINDIPGACPAHHKDSVWNKPFIIHVEELCHI